MNEAETRAEHIDPALKAAGWGVVEGSRIRRDYPISPGRIEGHSKRGKPLRDWGVDLAIACLPVRRFEPERQSV